MIRQPERKQLNRLTIKTLDQVFIMRAKEGLGCSQFEAEALTDIASLLYSRSPSKSTTSTMPLRCPVRKAKAGGCSDPPLYLLLERKDGSRLHAMLCRTLTLCTCFLVVHNTPWCIRNK